MDVSKLAEAYKFDSTTMTIGAFLVDGAPVPDALVNIPVGMLNRHGLVAGGTGTGKTRTVQLLAEGLSANGVSVFLSDVKGDLTGLLEPGPPSEKLTARAAAQGQAWQPAQFPVESLSLGETSDTAPGAPIRATVTDFGPILLSRALELNQTQSQSLQLIFTWADKKGLELIDLKDLKAVVQFLTDEGKDELKEIGGVSTQTAGVILRAVSTLEAQGGDVFFGEPDFETADLMRAIDGKGVISILEMNDLMNRPALASAFLMWLLADLFNGLPEVGDADKPKLVVFFDEAHLLFSGASKEFLASITQTVKLIRSKGVGIIFITQTPKDIPEDVLGQLGTRIQHALRAFTPDDKKALKATADTFPESEFDVEELLTSLGTGEAIVTTLDPKGRPTPTAPTKIWAPASVMGPASPEALAVLVAASPLGAKYGTATDRFTAFEDLEDGVIGNGSEVAGGVGAGSASDSAGSASADSTNASGAKGQAFDESALNSREQAELELERKKLELELKKQEAKAASEAKKEAAAAERAAKAEARARANSPINKALTSFLRSAGTQVAREITRSVFGARRR
ncbi:MAG: DUF853 domain-containing protein [Mobiluncus sp.]|uniref:helicase HerA-like domain-containing protein n=1 Tax=Mobiluncus sp. TaxID=47293 RepID=UPI002584B0EE|nr:helicase HerA-like domain-containing protein [Mobiluncus sp.]MCI6584682.1 DUF853 domain-containing protein [Mobiluncus sp.]